MFPKFFLLFLSCFSFATASQDDFMYFFKDEKSLAFYLDCNGNIKDKSVNNLITLSNYVTFTSDRNNVPYFSCHFDRAKDNYLFLNTAGLPDFNQLILSFWTNPTSVNTQYDQKILNFNSSSKSNVYLIFSIINSKFSVIANGSTIVSTDIKAGEWQSIIIDLTLDTVSIYIDGKLATTSQKLVFPDIKDDIDTLTIGRGYTGDLDEIRVYYNSRELDITEETAATLYLGTRCSTTQFFDGSSCVNCNSYMKGCNGCLKSSECYYCHMRFFFNETSSQCECRSENCKECDNEGICSECEQGYSKNLRGNCVANDCSKLDYCTKCDDNETCYKCVGEYEIYGTKCKLPSLGITGVVLTYLLVIVVIWVVILVIVRPKLIN